MVYPLSVINRYYDGIIYNVTYAIKTNKEFKTIFLEAESMFANKLQVISFLTILYILALSFLNSMKRALLVLVVIVVGLTANAQHMGKSYRLKKVIPVLGRQGIAIDKDYYYVSDTKTLYKYDKTLYLREN